MTRSRWILVFAVLPLLGAALPRSAAAEEGAQAKYLYDLVQFVTWPSQDRQADPKAPILIGVIGSVPLQEAMESLLKDQAWQGRAYQVKGFAEADLSFTADFRLCNVLYIAPSKKGELPGLLKAIKGSSALTVSDMKGFNVMGGMIELGEHGGEVVSTVTLDPVSAAGIFINPKFLRVVKTPLRPQYFGRPTGR